MIEMVQKFQTIARLTRPGYYKAAILEQVKSQKQYL